MSIVKCEYVECIISVTAEDMEDKFLSLPLGTRALNIPVEPIGYLGEGQFICVTVGYCNIKRSIMLR